MDGAKARATITDVAAASGVSRATVSFVLRDSPNQSISASTRERVRQAARDLGYVPLGIARALREGTSRIVVLTVDTALDGNYARSYVRGLDGELTAHQHVLFVRYVSGDAARPGSSGDVSRAEREMIDAISPRAVLGFGAPYLTGRELDDSGGGWRDGLAAHVAAQVSYLASRGHTRIALALPETPTPLREVRQRFTNQAAAALGLPPPIPVAVPRTGAGSDVGWADAVTGGAVGMDGAVADGAVGMDGAVADGPVADGAVRLPEFLAALGQATAVAAFDDDVALRVLSAMRMRGLSAPGDLAVIGFDDNGYGALTAPTLTSLHIDAEVHGRLAARAILGLPADDLSPAPGRVVVRESA